jgi:hypothetical protein
MNFLFAGAALLWINAVNPDYSEKPKPTVSRFKGKKMIATQLGYNFSTRLAAGRFAGLVLFWINAANPDWFE